MENPLANIESIEQIADPVQRARESGRRLGEIPAWQARLREIRQAAVAELRSQGLSLSDIGRELGLHRNRVQQILEGRPGGGKGGVRRPRSG